MHRKAINLITATENNRLHWLTLLPQQLFMSQKIQGLSANKDLCPEHSHVSKPIRIARRMEVYSYVFVFRMLHRVLYLASQRYNNLLCACYVSFGRWIRSCFSYLPLFLRLATQITDINGNWERVPNFKYIIFISRGCISDGAEEEMGAERNFLHNGNK